jgi:hypothetical protein
MIDIQVQDETGREEQTFDDPEILKVILARRDERQGMSCLRFIDPYGNAVFNQLQIPALVAELRDAAAGLDGDLERRATRLLQFIEAAHGEPHVYVGFIGD